jgi:hypothetical protein
MNAELIQKLEDLLKRTSKQHQYNKLMEEQGGYLYSGPRIQSEKDLILINAAINTIKQIGNTTTAP